MAKFDLTAKNCQYLDRHLTFPLLEFLLQKKVSSAAAIVEAKKGRRMKGGKKGKDDNDTA